MDTILRAWALTSFQEDGDSLVVPGKPGGVRLMVMILGELKDQQNAFCLWDGLEQTTLQSSPNFDFVSMS